MSHDALGAEHWSEEACNTNLYVIRNILGVSEGAMSDISHTISRTEPGSGGPSVKTHAWTSKTFIHAEQVS